MNLIFLLATFALLAPLTATLPTQFCIPPAGTPPVPPSNNPIPYTCKADFFAEPFEVTLTARGSIDTGSDAIIILAAGSNSILRWDWNLGCAVTRIQNVTIVGILDEEVRGTNVRIQVSPEVITPLPIDFKGLTKDEVANATGTLSVVMPPNEEIPMGTYRFNIWVHVKDHGVCSFYTKEFGVVMGN